MAQRDYSNLLIVTEGGHPNSAQRAAATQFWSARAWPKFAFITASANIREALSAFKWIGFARYCVFQIEQLTDALRSVDLSETDIPSMTQAITRMRERLGGVPQASSTATA